MYRYAESIGLVGNLRPELPNGGAEVRSRIEARVFAETDPLTDVLLCPPSYLSPIPCCAVTRSSLRRGHATSRQAAMRQHRALAATLTGLGVTCHFLDPASELPDLCFTRDVAGTTPWGVSLLNPAKSHRASEVAQIATCLRDLVASPLSTVDDGHIEGGDVCIARDGLLIVGISGERTTARGAEAFARRFRRSGWQVVFCPFDAHFLHLDTIFCMAGPDTALAHVEALDAEFLATVAALGIEIVPVTYDEVQSLGCNILSVDGRAVIAGSAAPRVNRMLRQAGFVVHELDVSEMTACGGGIHCLTMPLRRGDPATPHLSSA